MYLEKIYKKIRNVYISNRNIAFSVFLLLAVIFSLVKYVLAATPNPGHNFTEMSGGLTLGDLIYGSATDTATALAGNASTTRKFLRQTGNGTIPNAPAWDTLASSDVGLGNVENVALSTTLANWTGSTNLTTLGTIATGTWNGAVIGNTYITSTLTGKTYNGLTVTPQATGFTISGGTASRTLTLTGDATISGTPVTNPMTTLGDVVYGGASGGVMTRLAGSAGFLKSTGASAPTWSTINLATSADVTGILPVANGGTGSSTLSANSVLLGNGTSAVNSVAPGTSGNLLISNGTTWTSQTGAVLIGTRVLTSGTSYTPTSGTNKIMIELWGGGGAGGGCNNRAGCAGGGGGSGGYAKYYMTGVGAGPYTYAIGAGGTGVSGAAGNAGTNTTFNTGTVTITAYHGEGGGSVPGGPAVKFAFGGAGGVISTNGQMNGAGAPGGWGMTGTVRPAIFSGYGGSTSLGGGGTGIYNLTAPGVTAETNSGSGGGGANGLDPPASAGGDGADGVIVITEFR